MKKPLKFTKEEVIEAVKKELTLAYGKISSHYETLGVLSEALKNLEKKMEQPIKPRS